MIDRPVSSTLICLSTHSLFPPRRSPLIYACCAAGGFLMPWGGTGWFGMLLNLFLTISDLTWTHQSPSHLPCKQKNSNGKMKRSSRFSTVSFIYNMYVVGSGWINAGCQGLSGLKAKAVMHEGTGHAGCAVDRFLYLQIGAVTVVRPKFPKIGMELSRKSQTLANVVQSLAYFSQNTPTSTGSSHLTNRL